MTERALRALAVLLYRSAAALTGACDGIRTDLVKVMMVVTENVVLPSMGRSCFLATCKRVSPCSQSITRRLPSMFTNVILTVLLRFRPSPKEK